MTPLFTFIASCMKNTIKTLRSYIFGDFYINCTIITMDDDVPFANSMFVHHGKIKSIGDCNCVAKTIYKQTVINDMHGNTIVPGFIESHTHPDVAAFMHDFVDLSGFTHSSNTAVWEHLKCAVKKYNPGEWIICKGLDHMLINDLQTPTIQFLDSIAPHNPVVIVSQVLHSYWANSMAFKLANITNSTPNPTTGSFYERNIDGALTGLIVEQDAFLPIRIEMMKAFSKWKIIKNTYKVMNEYIANGNTSIVTAGITTQDGKILKLYKLIAMLPFRILKICPRNFVYIDKLSEKFLPKHRTFNNFFNIIGVKMWYDGSPYVGSMYMSHPYMDSSLTKELHVNHCNNKHIIDKSDMKLLVEKYITNGWKLLVHTQGDLAISETLDAFASVKNNNPLLRHRLEHCMLLNDTLINKMNDLQITPSFHINHIYYYGHALPFIIGNNLTSTIFPINSYAKQTNSKYSLHSDCPMFESNPLSLIATAVSRKTKIGNNIIGKNECVSIYDALKSMTIMAAWQLNMDHCIGSLKYGKFADFVVLNINPLSLENNPDDIRNIKILNVYINGSIAKN